MTVRLVAFACGAVLSTFASAAVAQTFPGSDQVTPGSQEIVPTARIYEATVGATLVYDSNVSRSGEAIAAARGLKLADDIFTPEATIDIVQPFGRESLFLKGLASYDFYGTNHILDAARVNVDGGGGVRVGRCEAGLTGGYRSQQTNLEELNAPIVRNIEQQSSLSVAADCKSAGGLFPTVLATQTWDTNSAAALGAPDYQSFDVEAGLAYGRPAFGVLSALGQFEDTTVTDRATPVAGFVPLDGYELYGATLRYDRRLGAKFEGVVTLSYVSLRPDSPLAPSFSGPTFSVDVTYRATGRITAHLMADRVTTPSNVEDATYAVANNYLAEATYAVSPRIALRLGASGEISDYKGLALPLADVVTHDDLSDLFANIRFDATRHLSMILDARWEDRTANLTPFNYSSARVSLTVTARN